MFSQVSLPHRFVVTVKGGNPGKCLDFSEVNKNEVGKEMILAIHPPGVSFFVSQLGLRFMSGLLLSTDVEVQVCVILCVTAGIVQMKTSVVSSAPFYSFRKNLRHWCRKKRGGK